MNTYLQAAVHNLKTVRAEKAIAERDRDRYFDASTANFEQFKKVEAELVAEQEKVRSLEAELARVRQEAIADFKASPEFEELLTTEYDQSFPETFKSSWERISNELSSQINGVSLERFPVPSLAGEGTPSLMAVEDLTDSFPSNTQDGENPSEDMVIEEPNKGGEDLGAQDVEAQYEEAQDEEAQLQGKGQDEDIFDDGLP